jgi:hypothetical protein
MQPNENQTPDSDLSPITEVPKGLYCHYKGNTYEVIGTARHSETLEPMVVYRALYGAHGLWVRPAAMFFETVTTATGTQPRFEKLMG